MSGSNRSSIPLPFVGVILLVVVGGLWYVMSSSKRVTSPKKTMEDTDTPPSREPRPQTVKIYGPIVRATPRTLPKKKQPEVRERPKPYVPPRYRVVLRRPPEQVPVGAPTFPPLTNKKFYTLSRAKFKRWANLPIAQMGARFTPDFRYGRLNGIKVAGLDDHSFYNRMGLYREDVIEKINGRQVVAPGQARKYFQAIGSRYRNITIQFRRGGKVRIVDFSLK